MFKRFIFFGVCLMSLASIAHSEFVGQLEFAPVGCEANLSCILLYDFGYIDPNGIGWQTVAGDTTDGASIPQWAQPIIGKPYKEKFIMASVIHDHYCDRHVRPESQTHRAFYDALIENRVPTLKAKVMYYAVIVGASHWKDLIPGTDCNVGEACIQNVSGDGNLHGGKIVTTATGEKQLLWPESYDALGFSDDLRQVELLIGQAEAAFTAEDIESLAKARHISEFHFITGDSIVYKDSSRFPKK